MAIGLYASTRTICCANVNEWMIDVIAEDEMVAAAVETLSSRPHIPLPNSGLRWHKGNKIIRPA